MLFDSYIQWDRVTQSQWSSVTETSNVHFGPKNWLAKLATGAHMWIVAGKEGVNPPMLFFSIEIAPPWSITYLPVFILPPRNSEWHTGFSPPQKTHSVLSTQQLCEVG